MKIVKLHHPLSPKLKFDLPVVLAMGFFDGLHLGHQHVIRTARKFAKRRHLKLAVLTYNHYPALVYRKLSAHDQRYLTLPSLKMTLLKRMGVQIVYQVDYTYAFQKQTPQQFVDNYLIRLNAKVVVAGFDHTYGPKSTANMKRLPGYVHHRIKVVTVPACLYRGRKVSSTRIRYDLDRGQVKIANTLLGRPFQTGGVVVHGYARGRQLGYPTINVSHSKYQWLPSVGVYLVRVQISHHTDWIDGIASVGHNVTFGRHALSVEVYLLNFNRIIYGEHVKIDWLLRTRGQIKFKSSTQLVHQLKIDALNAQKYFRRII